MSTEQPIDLSKLDCESRYDYFLSAVGEEREVWILINDDDCFLKIYSEEEGFEYLPVWPTEADAQAYLQTSGEDLKTMSIALPEFLNKWITGLTKDDLVVGVSPGEDKSVWLTEPAELKADIQEELSSGW